MASAKPKFETIDEYLAGVNPDQRVALEKLRRAIRAAAPNAEECISYRIPAFRLNGRALVFFGAWVNHCAFYPGSSAALKKFRSDLKGFRLSKGTIRFSPDSPLPVALVKSWSKRGWRIFAVDQVRLATMMHLAMNWYYPRDPRLEI